MTQRTPSSVPFAILIVVSMAIVPFLRTALSRSSVYWATALLLTAVVLSLGLLLLLKRIDLIPSAVLASLWLVPLLIVAAQGSLLVMIFAVPMLAALTRYLPVTKPPWQHGFLSAVMLQCAFALQLGGRPFAALLSACAGIGLILWAKEPAFNKLDLRPLSALIAVALTFILLSPDQLLMNGQAAPLLNPNAPASTSSAKGSSASAHLGIILKPDIKALDRKLPPPPVFTQVQRTVPATPIDIPFSGVYWLFQQPLMGPPANSPVIHSSPGEGKYRSDDETPVRLDAHQSFNSAFPSKRLSGIDVALLSNDTYPKTLSLELIAYNSDLPQYRMSMGRKPIEFLPFEQTLSFTIPPSPAVDEFDELLLRVHLTAPRQFIAPRIAIHKFRMYPR